MVGSVFHLSALPSHSVFTSADLTSEQSQIISASLLQFSCMFFCMFLVCRYFVQPLGGYNSSQGHLLYGEIGFCLYDLWYGLPPCMPDKHRAMKWMFITHILHMCTVKREPVNVPRIPIIVTWAALARQACVFECVRDRVEMWEG